MSLYLAPPDSRLANAVAAEGWLDDERSNLDMGYGSGEKGAQRAYEGFREAFEGDSLFGIFRGTEPVAFVVLRKPSRELAQFHGLVAPKYRGTVLAARVIQAIERAALGNGTYRLETEVLARNHRALRLLKGLGFVQEGAHKARHWMDGRKETTVTLRMLRPEWHRGDRLGCLGEWRKP